MSSTAFEQLPLSGFHTKKIESLAVARSGAQLFAGTADGSLMVYECRPDADADADARDRPRGFACAVTEVLRKFSRDRKAVGQMGAIAAWGVLVAVVDGGALAAYDLATLRALAPLADLLDFAAAPSAACGTEEGGVFACRARAPLEPGATPTVDYASARHAGRFAFDYGFALDARGDDASATLSFPRWVERLGAALGDAEWAPRVASREPTLALEFERARRAGVSLAPRDVSASFVAGSLIGRAAAAAVAVAAEDGHDPGRVVAAAAAALRDDHGAAAEAASRECEAGAHPAAPACIAAAVLLSELAVLDALAHLPAR